MSTAHAIVYAALTHDAALNTLGIDEDSCWAAGSLDGPQPTPFIVVRWGPTTRGIGASNSGTVTIYVHDEYASYDRINQIIIRIREVMLGLTASGDPRNWITQVDWLGDSSELSDDTYRTIMRNAEFNVVANTL